MILNWLIQCIGRDGNLLLGVGPRPDGTIAPDHAAALLEIGDWLKLNGEAVYGTRGGPYLPGSWGVSTRKGDKVFLFVTAWRHEALRLPALPAKVKSARLITRGKVDLEQQHDLWTFRVAEQFHRPVATIIELTLDREAATLPVVKMPEPVSQGKPVSVSGILPSVGFTVIKPSYINDGSLDTNWSGPQNSTEGWAQIDLGGEHLVDWAVISEGPMGTRCGKFTVQAQVGGEWKTVATGTGIGAHRALSFEPVKARVFRLTVAVDVPAGAPGGGPPVIAEFQLYAR